jgi:hypothetical protein
MDDEEKTNETVADKPEPETDPVPASAAPEASHDNSLSERIDSLAETVASLAESVSNIVSKADPDTTPVRRPWTHWGSK